MKEQLPFLIYNTSHYVIPRAAKRSRGIHGSCDYAQDDSSSAQDDGDTLSFHAQDDKSPLVIPREAKRSRGIHGCCDSAQDDSSTTQDDSSSAQDDSSSAQDDSDASPVMLREVAASIIVQG